MHNSIATIDSPQFINLEPLDKNPLISKCTIKVLYLGLNRNGTYIDKAAAEKMAKTLRGAPIVGYFNEKKGDFGDHERHLAIKDGKLVMSVLTKPYGFVSENTEAWFQAFDDYDEYGIPTTREYLMTTGYLWTGQFEECRRVIQQGRPQSMELENSITQTAKDESGMEFCIINDAIISKLCILGDDVEPCFEGSSVTSYSFEGEKFKEQLFSMINELKEVYQYKGESNMDNNVNITVEDENKQKDTPNVEDGAQPEVTEPMAPTAEPTTTDPITEPEPESTVEPTIPTEDEEGANVAEPENAPEEPAIANEPEAAAAEPVPAGVSSEEYNLLLEENQRLKNENEELNNKYSLLQAENANLSAFKASIEAQEKDALIASFSTLTEEEKEEVIRNKNNYSLNEIEAKLSVVYTRKQMSANNIAATEENNKGAMMYSLGSQPSKGMSSIERALMAYRQKEQSFSYNK